MCVCVCVREREREEERVGKKVDMDRQIETNCAVYCVHCMFLWSKDSGVSRGGGGGGLRVLEHPLAQAVSYINEASGSGPASPGFSKRDHFFSKYYA